MGLISPLLSVTALVVFPALFLALLGWPIARLARTYTDGLEQVALCVLCGEALLFVVQALAYGFALPGGVVPTAVATLLVFSLAVLVADWRRQRVLPLGEYALPLTAWVSLAFLALAGASFLVVHGLPNALLDWGEHYLRAQLFLQRMPPETRIGIWSLAARGPLFNAVAAALMAVTGTGSYWAFSVLATLLNGQVVLPLALLLRRFAGLTTSTALAVAVAVLLCAPIFNWNLVFTWTKLAVTGWILLALALSLKAVESRDARPAAWGVVAMAVAFLTHFLAFLYAAVLAPCLVYYAYRERLSPRPLVVGAVAGGLLAGGWMLYLFDQFGVQETLRSNSTLGSYQAGPDEEANSAGAAGALRVLALNAAATVVPGPVRTLDVLSATPLKIPHTIYQTVRTDGQADERPAAVPPVFLIAQLEGAVGWTGLALLLAAPVLARTRRPGASPGRFVGFWWYFALVGIPVNLWATRWYSDSGVLNQNFQPYLCLAAVWVVTRLAGLPAAVRAVAAVAWLCECVTRVAYIIQFQTRELPIYAGWYKPPFSANKDYITNYQIKVYNQLVMLRDLASARGSVTAFACALAILGVSGWLLTLLWPRIGRRKGGAAAPENRRRVARSPSPR
jgi:hypothetical protein